MDYPASISAVVYTRDFNEPASFPESSSSLSLSHVALLNLPFFSQIRHGTFGLKYSFITQQFYIIMIT